MKLLTTCRLLILLTFSALFSTAGAQCTFNLNAEVVANTTCFGLSDGIARAIVSGSDYQESGLGKPSLNPGGFGSNPNFNLGLLFDVNTDTLTIDSVTVYPTGTGNVVVRITDPDGPTVVSTSTLAVTAATGAPVKIPIGYTLAPGNGYLMDAVGSTVTSLEYNSGNISYPYFSVYSVLDITGASDAMNRYYNFYAWDVTITPSVNFAWSNAATGPINNGLSVGTYTVTMTDNNACSAYETATVTISEPSQIIAYSYIDQFIYCAGDSAKIYAEPTGGEINYSGIGRVSNLDGNDWNAFSYGLKFDVNSDSVLINSVDVYPTGTGTLVVNIHDNNNNLLYTSSQSITGGVGNATQVNLGFSLAAGTDYTINANGTTGLTGLFRSYTNNFFPYESPGGAISIKNSNFDNGAYYWFYNFNVTEKQAFSFAWSNGATTDTVVTDVPNEYFVTITSSNGCTSSDNVFVDSSYDPPLTIGSTAYDQWFDPTATYCPESPQFDNWLFFRQDLDTASYDYSEMTFSGSELGSVISCTDDSLVQLIAAALSDGSTVQVLCNGYYWRVTSCSAAVCSDSLDNVTLSVNTTPLNACGCITGNALRPGIGNANWGGANGLTCGPSRPVQNFRVEFNYNNSDVIDPTCYGLANGQIIPIVSGGYPFPGFQYNWSNASTSDTLTNLTSGTYTLTVTDGNGCTIEKTYVLTAADSLGVSAQITHPSSFGATDGAISPIIIGGVAPFAYTWSDASTDSARTGLNSGLYELTITDANGCTVDLGADLFYIENGILLTSNVSGSGYAADFDGINDYIDLGDATNLPLGSQARTIEAWIKLDTNVHSGLEFIQSYGNVLPGTMFAMIVDDGNLGLAIHNHNRIFSTNLDDGQWHHVAISYPIAGDLSSISAYVDGELQSSVFSTLGVQTTVPNTSTNSHTIGTYIGGSGTEFSGQIDEIRYWATNLDQSDIQAWMCKKVTDSHPNFLDLSAYYRFDEGESIDLYDVVNSNHGELFNMDNADWVLSGAAIGDQSKRSYPTAEIKDTLPNGNIITVNGFTGSPFGAQYFWVNDSANNSIFPLEAFNVDTTTYFGVKLYGGGTYDVKINFSNNPFFAASPFKNQIRVFKRENGSDGNWVAATGFFSIDVDNNIIWVRGQSGTEYVVGFSNATYPDEPGSGYSAQFDGVNDHIVIAHDATQVPSSNITIEAWVKPAVGGINQNVILKGNYGWGMTLFSGNQLGYWSNSSALNCPSFGSVPIGVWSHLAIVVQKGVQADFYINGELVGSSTNALHTTINSGFNQDLIIGKQGTGCNCNYWDGELDEIRVWDTNLSPSTIQQYMTQKVNANHPDFGNLVTYYRMDDTLNGTAVKDLMGASDGIYTDPDGLNPWTTSGASLGDTAYFKNPPLDYNQSIYSGNHIRIDNIQATSGGFSLYAIEDTASGSNYPAYIYDIDESNYWGVKSFNDSLFDLHLNYGSNPALVGVNEDEIRVLKRDNGEDGRWSPVSGALNVDESGNWVHIRNQSSGEYIVGRSPNPIANSLSGAGNALDFSASGERITASNSALGNIRTNDPITVEAWVKPDVAISGFRYILNSESSGTSKLRVLMNNGLPRFTIRDAVDNAFGIQSLDSINDGEWHHLAYVYDGSETPAGMSIYIDGVLASVSTTTNPINGGNTYSDSVYLGRRSANATSFNGTLDEVRIWRSELTQATINAWNFRELNNSHPDFSQLISYYQFNEGTGTTTYDAAGGADGLLTNNPVWVTSGAYIGDTMNYVSPATPVNMSMDNGLSVTVKDFEGAADAVVIYKIEDTASFSSIPTQIASAVTSSYFGVKLINGGTYNVEIDYSGNPTFAAAANEKDIRVLRRSDASDGTWEQVTSRIFVDVNTNTITIPGQSGTEFVLGFANTTYPNRAGAGTALIFDGLGESVDMPASAEINNLSDYTYSAWVYFEDNSINPIFSKQAINAGDIDIYHGAAGLVVTHNFNNGGIYNFTVGPNVPLNRWVHIAVVNQGGSISVYLNGESFHTASIAAPSSNNYGISLGSTELSGQSLNGMLDEVRLWSTPLTQNLIKEWMCRKLKSDHDSINKLIAYYRFDEDQGDSLYDLAMGNNGALQFMEAGDWINSGAALGDTSIFSYPAITESLIVPNGDDIRIAPINAASGHHIYYVGEKPLDTIIKAGLDTFLTESYYGVFTTEETATYQSIFTFNSVTPANDAEINLGIRENGTKIWSQSNLSNRQYTRGGNSVRNDSVIGSSEFILASGANNALNFDGVNDWIACSGSSIFDLGSNFTVSFWMKPNLTTGPAQTIVGRFNGYYVVYESTNDQVELFGMSYTGDDPQVNSQIPITDTQWHFVAYTYDGDTLRGYLDDSLVVNEQKTFSLSPNVNSLQIGTRNGTNFFGGSLDELRIWKRALCETELFAYKNCENQNTDQLSLYLDFNVGAAADTNTSLTLIPDRSTNGFDANFAGAFALTGFTSNIVDGPDAVFDTCGVITLTPIIASISQDSLALCFGDSTSATVTPSGGSGVYNYNWSNGSDSSRAVNLSAGTYTVIVSDGGCAVPDTLSINITQPDSLEISLSLNNAITCNGGSDGEIGSTTLGGTLPYTYLWSNASTADTLAGLSVGTYGVTVTDANGCSDVASINLLNPVIVGANTVLDSNVSCNGGSDGGLSVIASGGTAPYTYAWSNAATTSTITGLTAATYTVTVSDANGCTATATRAVGQPSAIAPITFGNNVTCNGGNDGSIIVISSGGTGAYTHSWSNSGTSNTITSLSAGTYTVTVSDANSCTAVASRTINQPTAIVASTVVDSNVSCNGLSDGGATASATGGTGAYTYLWSNAATTTSITGVATGTYTVTITDNNGCTDVSSSTITEPVTLAASTVIDSNVSCNGGSDGGATASATGGTGAYTYLWSNAATTASIAGLAAGTYTVTITDNNGCTDQASTTITEPAVIGATISAQTNVDCNGNSTGSATAAGSGGTGAYTYSWSNGPTTATNGSLAAGTYTVSISDANSCGPTTTTVTITEPAALGSSISAQTNVDCNGNSTGSATAAGSGGTAPYTYAWSNGPTTAINGGLAAGTYTASVTDANGCGPVTSSATITEAAILSAVLVNDSNVSCNGGSDGGASVTPSGGTAPYTYLWSNSATTQSITGLSSPGPYNVTVTDNNGCQFIPGSAILISQPTAIVASTVVDSNVSCNGLSDGGATASATGGTGAYTYLWSNAATTTSITGVATGTYTVTITDNNGCTDVSSSTITEPVTLAASTVIDSNVSCNGGSDGGATASATGGTGAYTYLWSNAATTASITGVAAGTYTVTITDANGCADQTTATLTEPTAVGATISAQTNVDCNGSSTGSATAAGSGGTGAYTYAWSNGATTAINGSLAAGTYTVSITDANGCGPATATATITEPTVLGSSISAQTNVDCNGNSTGSATAAGSGGTAPYTYAWSNGPTTAINGGLAAGTYTVSVTDANGCGPVTSSTSITEPAVITTLLAVTSNLCFGDANGTIINSTSGGTSPYTYAWNDGPTISNRNNLLAGTYTVTVTDNNGCTNVESAVVSEPAQLVASTIADNNASCNGISDGGATASAIGGTGAYTYSWSNAATTASISALAAGTYTVTITDAFGCTDVDSVIISEPASLIASASVDNNITCKGDMDGQATASGSGGTAPYTYSWSNAAATATASSLDSGSYYVTITDANGCTDSASVSIGEPDLLDITSLFLRQPVCNGDANGRIWMTYTGGTTPYTFNWSNGSTNDTLFNVAAGAYTVTITDANGCTTSSSGGIPDPPVLSVSIALDSSISCFGGSDGGLTASSTGGQAALGVGGYSYQWSTTDTDSNITGLSAATYTVTVSDAFGCTSTASITLTEPASITPSAIVDNNATCNGASDGGATASASGGTGAYTYAWSNSATTATISGVSAGTYTVSITDANGCGPAITSVTITEPALLFATISAQTNVDCNGNSTGSATAVGIGGTAPYTYAWSNGATSATNGSLAAGTYTVSISDANGCGPSITAATITEPIVLGSTISAQTNVDCNGNSTGSATAAGSGGTAPYTYAWSNGPTTAINGGLAAGTYTVSVTDANGCGPVTSSTTITEPTAILASAVVDNNVSCNGLSDGGATASATGGTGAYTYVWSNAATTASITGVIAGTYTVTITDANGCADQTTISITQPSALLVFVNNDSTVSCNGLSDGGASAFGFGGTSPYTYAWSNSATTIAITGVSAGTYTVTITDANGCTDTENTTITEPVTLIASAVVDSNVSCAGFSDGGATASATGGTAPYTYNWSNSSTTASTAGLFATSYYVTITDANGCTDSSNVTVSEPASLIASTTLDSNVSCNGLSDGGATASATGGTMPYTYSWSNSSTSANMTDAAGTYYVTITDANGCTDSSNVTITQPTVLTAFFGPPINESCSGANDGQAAAAAIGGTLPYTYLWSNSATTSNITGLGAATYIVTVSDANGCSDVDSVAIIVDDAIPPTPIAQSITVYLDASGQVTIDSNAVDNGSFDNCAISSITTDSTNFDCSEIGPNTVEMLVFDSNGNNNAITTTVTVLDTIKPTVLTQNINAYLNSGGVAIITPADINNGSFDNCGAPGLSLDSTAFDCSEVGANTVTLYAVDGSGNLDSATATVTVIDTIKPNVLVNNFTKYLDASGLATITLPEINNGSLDNCSFSFNWDANLDCSDIGVKNVALIVTDVNGNVDSAISIVTVLDTIRPVAIAQNLTIYLDGSGLASITANDIDNGSTDNCSPITLSIDSSNFECSEIGVNAVEFFVEDGSGNRDSAMVNVTVLDTSRPAAIAQPITVYLDASGQVTIDSNAVDNGSSDNCQIAYFATDSTNFDCSEIGANTVEMLVVDVNGNRDSTTAVVTVVDTVRPTVITMNHTASLGNNGDDTISVSDINNGSFDNCGIASMVLSKTIFDCSDVGLNNVTLVVTDTSGNVDSAIAVVTVEDTWRPSAFTQNITVYLDTNGQVSLDSIAIDAGSSDNCIIDRQILSQSSFNCSDIGPNSVQMLIIDPSGNRDSSTSTVTVLDTNRPEAITQNISVYIDVNGFAFINANDINNGSTDNCGIASITVDSTSFDCSEVGANTVELLVIDVNGNRDSATAIVTVIDSVRPVAAAQNITVYLDASGLATIDSNAVDNGSTDNCAIASITTDITSFSCAEVGANTVEMLVIDVNGNRDSVSATVNVIDSVSPIAITQAINVYLDASGLATIDSNAVDNGSSDNCAIAFITTDSTTFDCSEVGANTVEMLVIDANSNRDSATATVTVIDTVRPDVFTNNIIVYLDPSGLASITVNDIDNSSADACGIATRTLDSTNFDCSEVGPNTVTLTVTDNNGNVDSATATVTVLDTLRPIAITQNITIYLDAAGIASIDSNAVDNGSNDNCVIAEFRTDSTNFDCSEIGANTVEMIVEDGSGNTDTTTAIVTVLDTVRPQTITQTINVYLDPNGFATIDSNAVDNGSSDNCTIASITTDSTNFDCSEVGANTVEMLVIDVNGNRDSSTAIVNVIDSVRPIAIAQPITVYLDAAGQATIDSNAVDNGSSDNCSIASITTDSTNFDCSEVGANTVEMLVIDVNGNRDSITTTVTVLDTIRPTAITQTINVYLDASGLATIDSNAVDNGSNDNCAIVEFRTDSTNFDCSEVGANTVEMIVEDGSGNTDTTTAIVNVIDTVRPQAITQTINIYLDPSGFATIDSNAVDNSSSDNCAIASITTDSTNFDCSEVGANTVEMLVIDVNGNRDSATATVNVIDSVRPIAIAQFITVYLDAAGQATIDSNSVDNGSSDNCSIASITTDSINFDCSEVGINTVEMLVIDVNGNRDSVTTTVTVLDTIRPTAITQTINVYLDASGLATIDSNAVDNGSSDNCQVDFFTTDITSFGCADVGANTVEMLVVDVNGNRDSTTATVNVIDTVRPQAITQTINIYLDASGLATIDSNAVDNGSSDNCSIASITTDSTNFDCSELGANTVEMLVIDVNGNRDSTTATVNVIDTLRPTAIAQTITVYLDAAGQVTIDSNAVDNGSNDNCAIVEYRTDSTNFDCSEVGANTVEMIVEDGSGNTDTTTAIVNVIDTVRPQAITQTINVYLDASGLATIDSNAVDNGSSDNCQIDFFTTDITSFGCVDVGANTVEMVVVDVNGNRDSTTATVNVIDSVRPIAIAQPITVYLDAAGQASIDSNAVDNVSFDNCQITSITTNITNFTCAEVGANTVEMLVIDVNGNRDSVSTTVTVVDSIRPTAITQNITVYLDAAGSATIDSNAVDNGSTDNCQIDFFATDISSFGCADVGTVNVELLVVDVNGNRDSATATVTVIDTIAPVLSNVPANISVNNDAGSCGAIVTWTLPTGADNCNVDSIRANATSGDFFPIGDTTITYIVYDPSMNTDTVSFTITVTDNEDPVIVNVPATINLNNIAGQCNQVASWTAPTATDNCNVDSLVSNFDSGDSFPVGTTSVEYIAYDPYGNTDTVSFDVVITDNELPTISCLADTVICSTTFTFSTPAGNDNCAVASVVQTEGVPSGGNYPVGVTINKFVITDVNGNVDSCSFTVTRDPAPTAALAGPDQTNCTDTALLAANTPTTGTAVWTSLSGTVTFDDTTDPATIARNLSVGANRLIWSISNGVCDVSSDTVIINVDAQPTAANAGIDQLLCDITQTNLAATPTAAGNGNWTLISGGATIANAGSATSGLSNIAIGVNRLLWSTSNGVCPATTDTVDVVVSNTPIIDAGPDESIFQQDGIQLSVTSTPSQGVSYLWSPAFDIEGSATIANPFGRPRATTEFKVVVTDSLGCSAADSIEVEVKGELKIPTAFTPNNDGFNDTWEIKNLGAYREYTITVYNGLGNELFSTKKYDQPWDGRYNGNDMPVGSYYYVIQLTDSSGKSSVETGIVTIIK